MKSFGVENKDLPVCYRAMTFRGLAEDEGIVLDLLKFGVTPSELNRYLQVLVTRGNRSKDAELVVRVTMLGLDYSYFVKGIEYIESRSNLADDYDNVVIFLKFGLQVAVSSA